MNPKHERFAQLVAQGMSQAQAYRDAVSSKCSDENAWVRGSELARKVGVRIEELRAAVKAKATQEYVYEYEDAMRELDEAMAIAREKKDSKAITAAAAVKIKIAGLETEARKNNRSPFDGMTDEQLAEVVTRNMAEGGFTLQ